MLENGLVDKPLREFLESTDDESLIAERIILELSDRITRLGGLELTGVAKLDAIAKEVSVLKIILDSKVSMRKIQKIRTFEKFDFNSPQMHILFNYIVESVSKACTALKFSSDQKNRFLEAFSLATTCIEDDVKKRWFEYVGKDDDVKLIPHADTEI